MSEAIALKIGLQTTWDRGMRDLICNVDCVGLLQALQDEDSHRFMPILKEITELLRRQRTVALITMSRECNRLVSPVWSFFSVDVVVPARYSSSSPPIELEILIMMRDNFACV